MLAQFSSPFLQFLYDWQTLISAVLAFGAAGLGSVLLWRQIRLSQDQEVDRRRRRFAAARATLPHILSEIVSYLDSAMEWMCDSHADAGAHNVLADPPSFPGSVIQALERMIEATSLDDVAAACAEILSELQVFSARIESVARSSRAKHRVRVGLDRELEDHMLKAAQIHYSVGRLFPFARDEQDTLPDEDEGTSIFGSLMSLGCGELQFRGVYKKADELDRKRVNAAKAAARADGTSS